MRWLFGWLLCLLIAFLTLGCGPAISEKDMGAVIYEVPKVKGADQPYEMPELAPWQEEDERADQAAEEE